MSPHPGADRPRPGARRRILARHPHERRTATVVPRVHLVLAGRRGPGRLDLHRHGLWAERIVNMALAAIVCGVRDLGLADRETLPRTIARHLGGGHFPADRERRAIPGKRSGRSGRPALAGPTRRRRRCRGRRGPAYRAQIRYQRREGIGVARGNHKRRLGRRCRQRAARGLEATTAWADAARVIGAACRVRLCTLTGGGRLFAVSLFNDADGTSKREALRQWHLGVVRPLARMLSAELTEKFGRSDHAEIR